MIKIIRPECPNYNALSTKNYKHVDNKKALKEAGFDKCMYCESKVSHISYGNIEHIKPKSKFPDLEFDWENLGFSCNTCNNEKRDKFNESIPFINPYIDNPEKHVIPVGWFVSPKQGCARGEITINEIKLNRVELLERRKEKINQITKAIAACYRAKDTTIKKSALNELINEAAPDKEYSLCIKYLLILHEVIDVKITQKESAEILP